MPCSIRTGVESQQLTILLVFKNLLVLMLLNTNCTDTASDFLLVATTMRSYQSTQGAILLFSPHSAILVPQLKDAANTEV